ncbi:hypothetical protein L1987_75325 [Smallanthus sonchifolius]|uniref:Uncharacterized protein n=1 Tax=Smallanthus sonchifolius TaxID=185202 RepID=A0ACB9A6W0_9ASTR|nr:hypothetical protein L1987_75325 [Smallanthus sonchifolius]
MVFCVSSFDTGIGQCVQTLTPPPPPPHFNASVFIFFIRSSSSSLFIMCLHQLNGLSYWATMLSNLKFGIRKYLMGFGQGPS